MLTASCSVDKYLQPGQKVLHRNEVNVTMVDGSEVPPEVNEALSNIRQYYYQTPNKRFLFMRLKMRLYCSTNPDDSSGWSRFWRNQGEAPVVYDPLAAQRTAAQLATLLKTKGCFNSTVTTDTVPYGSNAVIARYNIKATHRRQIDDVTFGCRQHDVDSLMKVWKTESLLKAGDYYDQQKMTQEQNRIASLLRDSGYYYASPDLVRFFVDTTYDSQLLSIAVRTRLPQRQVGDSIQTNAPLLRYKLDKIYFYPNVSTSLNGQHRQFDTLVYPYRWRDSNITDYYFIHDKTISPSPHTLCRTILLRSNTLYNPRYTSITSNALFGLHNFKYVDISFEESPFSTDSNALLDARIRLLNNTRHRLSLSLELTNASNVNQKDGNFFTSGNLGLGTSLGYQNNNLFGGAELLKVEGGLLFDLPKNVFGTRQNDFHSTFSSFEYNLNSTLDLPSFLLPFVNRMPGQYNRPHTLIGISAGYIYRNIVMPLTDDKPTDVALERILFNTSFGYTWNHRRYHQHKFIPFNLTYTHILSGHEYYSYLDIISSDILRGVFQSYDYVLLNTHYEYTYSNQRIGLRRNFDYLNFSVETAGNLLNGMTKLLSPTHTTDSHYYQYFRLEGEYKRYIYWGEQNTLVLRALVGFGLPYGNSNRLPYEKMFVGGGPTTLRGWPLRYLGGYGMFFSAGDLPMGVGEFMLVGNIEQRFPIISIFEGAAFVDFGNVWPYSNWSFFGDERLSLGELLKPIALDVGVGLRANVSIATLRLDFAIPLFTPTYTNDDSWIGSNWNWKKIALNFGINYPF